MRVGFSGLSSCFCSSGASSPRSGLVPAEAEEEDSSFGHSFSYVADPSQQQPPSVANSSSNHHLHHQQSFKSLSGASVSANPTSSHRSRAAFETSSAAFSSLPLRLSSRSSFSGPVGDRDPSSSPRSIPRCRSDTSRRTWPTPLRTFRRRSRPHLLRGGSGHWVQGKAGEDRVHVVVAEDLRLLFVGVYDGFNGTDAADFLLCTLYWAVFNELRGLLWDYEEDQGQQGDDHRRPRLETSYSGRAWFRNWIPHFRFGEGEKTNSFGDLALDNVRCQRRMRTCWTEDHELVLEALSRALEMTEAAYFDMMDETMERRPEIALVGSCLLVVLMREDHVYVMNVGDSRAIAARCKPSQEGSTGQVDRSDVMEAPEPNVGNRIFPFAAGDGALQLSIDHSTTNLDEVLKIKKEHQDDKHCIVNGRVKGRLRITRAFGAAFLKQPKWNNRLLEMFRCKYVGRAPYVSSFPSLCHHRLGSDDKFLVISSDGLYQYLTNAEVVSHVQQSLENSPDGDPAQSLVEELLVRAAHKAGMDFRGLLDIPHGDRRRFHDDVTVIVISLEGRIWKSTRKGC